MTEDEKCNLNMFPAQIYRTLIYQTESKSEFSDYCRRLHQLIDIQPGTDNVRIHTTWQSVLFAQQIDEMEWMTFMNLPKRLGEKLSGRFIQPLSNCWSVYGTFNFFDYFFVRSWWRGMVWRLGRSEIPCLRSQYARASWWDYLLNINCFFFHFCWAVEIYIEGMVCTTLYTRTRFFFIVIAM